MQGTSQNTSKEGVIRYAEFVIRYKYVVLIFSILTVLLLAMGGKNLVPTNDYRVFFSDENPHLKAFDQQQKIYTKNDTVIFAISPHDGNVFSRETLAAVEEATYAAWQFPFVIRVNSVTNFQYSRAEGDDLIVEDLVEGARSFSDEQLLDAKRVVLNEPRVVGRLLNKDASVTGIAMTFQLPDESLGATPQAVLAANPQVVQAVRALKKQLLDKYAIDIHLSGDVLLSTAFFEASMLDIQTLFPLMFIVIIGVMLLLLIALSVSNKTVGELVTSVLSSGIVTVFVVLLMVLSIMVGMGVGGWMGIKLTPPSFAAPTIIMTLAVADAIHFLVTLYLGMRKGMTRHEAIIYSLRLNIGPIFLTSITTAVGFLSMNFSDTPPFHDLGNMTAIGVMAAFFLSVTFLPALLAIVPIRVAKTESELANIMHSLGEFVIRRRRAIFIFSSLLSVLFVAAVPLNEFNDNFVGYFSKNIEFRTDTDYVNNNLTGIYQIQYSMSAGRDYGVSEPEFLKKLDKFTEWMRAQEHVLHVDSFTDTFKNINKNMNGDAEEYYRLPEDGQLAAQYLLLYELSLPEGLDLNNQMDIGKSSTQIVVTVENLKSTQITALAERGTRWLKENTGLEAHGVGPAVMFSYISETNMKSMLLGTFVAIIIISLLILISLRSLRIGLLSLVPNLLPLAASFGLWGMLIGQVNVAVSMVTGMALGIVVDDSVHFLSKFLRARREEHMSREDAVRYAFSSVGLAIVVTSIILVCGFSILAMSNFGMNSNMAILTAIAIIMALVADFMLLPVLLLKLDKKHRSGQAADAETAQISKTTENTYA